MQPIPEKKESVIRKIQKLLALAQSPNQAEAELAAARAQTLLAQHNLEYAMVQEAHVAGGTTAPLPEKREKAQMGYSAMYKWQRDLWQAIAEANFCWWSLIEVWATQTGTRKFKGEKKCKRHLILGRESNVMAVRMLGEYLCDTIERLLPYEQNLSRAACSWRAGCAETLIERIEQQAEERKSEVDKQREAAMGEKALVRLVDVYESEYRANYDFQYGEGAYGRKLLRDAEWEQGQEERERRAAEYQAKKEREWLEYLQNETPEQKKEREKAEAKERRREERNAARRSGRFNWGSAYSREASRVDHEAKAQGREAGKSIGLNRQTGAGGGRSLE